MQAETTVTKLKQEVKSLQVSKSKKRVLGECLFISNLPGKASRMPVESLGKPRDSTCVLEAESGKLDIKGRHTGILFIS